MKILLYITLLLISLASCNWEDRDITVKVRSVQTNAIYFVSIDSTIRVGDTFMCGGCGDIRGYERTVVVSKDTSTKHQ